MARLNVLITVALMILVVIVSYPAVRGQALNLWEALRPVLADIQSGLTVIMDEITNQASSDLPSDDIRPPDDSPVFNIRLNQLKLA